jgi:superfamily II DNA/RNA helicase
MDNILDPRQEKFLNWLMVPPPNRVPSSQEKYAILEGVDETTLRRWKKKPAFKMEWEKRVSELQQSPERTQKLLDNPVEINIAVSKPPEQIVQEAFVVYEKQKSPLVKHLLKLQEYTRVIVFCSKKQNVKSLTSDLKRARFSVEEIHSDLEQEVREQVMQDFRNKKTKILVATDILSRGIDIDEIELVINYDVPNDGEDYIHRIGRTARAQTKGTAYTFITESEQRKFKTIEDLLEKEVTKAAVPEEFGETPEYNPAAQKSTFGGYKGKSGGGFKSGGGKSGGGNFWKKKS